MGDRTVWRTNIHQPGGTLNHSGCGLEHLMIVLIALRIVSFDALVKLAFPVRLERRSFQ